MKNRCSSLLLMRAYQRIQNQRSLFSVRALAKKVGVSHVFMARILKGQASLPVKRLAAVAKALQLDQLATAELKEALLEESVGPELSKSTLRKRSSRKIVTTEMYSEENTNAYTAISHWYELPILELLTCELPEHSVEYIARRMSLPEKDVASALTRLKDAGLIQEKNGKYLKAKRYIRFPARVPHPTIRNYYKQVLRRAEEELNKNQIADYNRRLITNLSIAINPENLELAKERLQKFLYDLSVELSEGRTREVYFLTSLLFPVTLEAETQSDTPDAARKHPRED